MKRTGSAQESALQIGREPVLNVREQVVERLGASIVRGDIMPGEPLPSEAKLCESFEVSRTVIREALRTLVTKGLLSARPKSGTKVQRAAEWNHLDSDVLRWRLAATETSVYLDKLYQLRTALDPMASAIAAKNASQAAIATLRDALQRMEDATTDESYVTADVAFHRGIYFATENEFFWPIAQMFDVVLRQSFSIAAKGSHRKRALVEHRAVFEAIAAGDAQLAHEATEVLLGHSANDLKTIRGRAISVI